MGDVEAIAPNAITSWVTVKHVRWEWQMSPPSVIIELERKVSKLRETAQGSAFQSVWSHSARRQLINEILETQTRLDVARRTHAGTAPRPVEPREKEAIVG